MRRLEINILIFDFECTTSNKGNPFDQTNKAVCIGVKWLMNDSSWPPTIIYDSFSNVQEMVNRADMLVAFNAKFDLHWLRKVGISFEGKRIWDCQLGEFLLNDQKTPYPSLDQAAEKYGLDKKLDVVKLEYWDKNIDTDEVPREILSSYCKQDLILTEQVFLKQREQFEGSSKYALFKLQCLDLVVLEEMEYNGIQFESGRARDRAKEIETEMDSIYQQIKGLVEDVPFNLNSGDHLSAILYGGIISIDDRIPIGVYKSGGKVGQTRYKIVTKDYELPRLVEPLEGTEIVKPVGSPTVWKTNEDVLRTLKLSKTAKTLVNLIQKYTKIEKLRGTYLLGWSELIDKMNWPQDYERGVGMIHGNLNQCVAATGRLSSTKPNLQNPDPETKTYCTSRYLND